ncbi:hypothetical protein HYPSUDRAFT_69093 [Hypholoma sublateritium FD-334 SS-4]|uniref:MYND-type domain-containing protein n=1 Tax=Hypholoma sublateritium (strain FD-334 SS-4) TaxID=945553 RepID=A0A0D2M8R9_HYPSF|nr:hypothetical protein HYPSUDRAFT_69093 [Hypholoma sublateritium FD-334 SS-4]
MYPTTTAQIAGYYYLPCVVCGFVTPMQCSRCKNSWYCSREHIRSDWPRHREECIPTLNYPPLYHVNLIATPPPAEPETVMVNAIHFAMDEERPEFVIIHCRPSRSRRTCPIPILDSFFEGKRIQSAVITTGLNGEPLRFPLQLWYAPQLLQQGFPENPAICNITFGATNKAWSSPFIVLKFNGSRQQGYSDAGSNDFPTLSGYFLSHK